MTYKHITFDQSEVLREFEKIAQNLFSEAVTVGDEVPKISNPGALQNPEDKQLSEKEKFLKEHARNYEKIQRLEELEKGLKPFDILGKQLSSSPETWNPLDYLTDILAAIPTPVGNPLAATIAVYAFFNKDYLTFFFNSLVAFPAALGLSAATGIQGKLGLLLMKLGRDYNNFLTSMKFIPKGIIKKAIITVLNFFESVLRDTRTIKELVKSMVAQITLQASYGKYARDKNYNEEQLTKYSEQFVNECTGAITSDLQGRCDHLRRMLQTYQ